MKQFGEMWSLVWRATLLAPVALVWFSLALVSWMARVFLPVLIGIAVFCADWKMAAGYAFLWSISVALWSSKLFKSQFQEFEVWG
jgi:hypothetical protein